MYHIRTVIRYWDHALFTDTAFVSMSGCSRGCVEREEDRDELKC